MAANNVEFVIDPTAHDCMRFNTQADGDMLEMRGFSLTPQQAADLAYLVNQPKKLKIEIKVIE